MSPLEPLAARAAKYTGRPGLRASVGPEGFRLGDDTLYGNLHLTLDQYGLREVYMRTRHFGLSWEDLALIRRVLSAPRTGPLEMADPFTLSD